MDFEQDQGLASWNVELQPLITQQQQHNNNNNNNNTNNNTIKPEDAKQSKYFACTISLLESEWGA